MEHEHEIAEDFRTRTKENLQQIKRIYDDKVTELTREHQQIIERLRLDHQTQLNQCQNDLQQIFQIEHQVQMKFYQQTVETRTRTNLIRTSKSTDDTESTRKRISSRTTTSSRTNRRDEKSIGFSVNRRKNKISKETR